MLRTHLETREKELNRREQMWEVKTQKLSKISEEFENNKHNMKKWQAELSNKECDLLLKINGLQVKEQELVQREQELALKGQRLMEQHRDMDDKQQNQAASFDERDLELESMREALGKKEQELIRGEEALSQREEKLKSEEIYLEKRQQVMQNREQMHEDTLRSLKEQQDVLKNRECSLDTRETELRQRESELTIRDNNMMDKHKLLQNQDLDLEKKASAVELLKTTLDGREKELEERQNQLDSKMLEINSEQDKMKRKREELEKWEKYLYNTELKEIQKESFSGHQRLTNSTESNGNAGDTRSEERMELENNRSVKNQRVKRILESKQKEEAGENDNSDGESEEDFFESSSASFQATLHTPWPASELRLMLLGDSWSSRHPARCTVVGPDADRSNPWKGEISGRRLTIVEPQGLKWRSGSESKDTFSQSIPLCHPGPHAFILVIPAYVSFTGQYRHAVERTMSAIGKASWRHTIILLTWGETLRESIQQHVKRNSDLEKLVRKCGNRCHVLNNGHRESDVVKLLEKVEEMLEGNNGQYYKLD
ncbi:protein CROWDED NUCLEI 3-like [Puntigrus tetrazona]|uniref:protein CROWDED NUCLEI 3-like n=1 Tax=Puntigrus tetrazona TaxID=1606681 RepID=UPI001C8A44F1|nr:protein CROWDED NUCLEI 3-like [Puntigrus tetrazona]